MKPTRQRGRRWAALGLAACLTAGVGGAAVAAPKPDPARFVVRTEGAGLTRAALQASSGSLAVTAVRRLGPDLAAVTVDAAGKSDAAVAKALNASPLIAAATADKRFTALGVPAPRATTDQYFPQQWDLWDASSTARAGGYGVDAPRAWTKTKGSAGVIVAVLDTGITPHRDFDGMSKVDGYDFVSQQDGVDTGDGDGWDADPSDPGDACAALGEDSSWHGTFVTGEIAAQHDNGGVAGEAPGVTIEPVRVLGACGGSEADTIAAIEWASGGVVPGVPPNAHPANVLSLSLGSADGACSAAMQTAVNDAVGRGVTVVAAAGNDGSPVADTSPANCANVISVAASTRSGGLADYSNYGTAAGSPTIAAPGGSGSTAATMIFGDSWTSTTTFDAAGDTASLVLSDGTSMAAPRVTAAVALLLSASPGLPPGEVRSRLVSSATPFAASSGCTAVMCGPGIVNAGNVVGATRLFVQVRGVRVTGTARAGHRLTAVATVWRPAPQRIAYRWLRDGKPIAGATHRTYVLRARDAGHRITVRATGLRAGTTTVKSTSTARRIHR